MLRHADARRGRWGLYFETGQGADFTNGHAQGTDMVVHEARKYGFARLLSRRVAEARGGPAWVGSARPSSPAARVPGPCSMWWASDRAPATTRSRSTSPAAGARSGGWRDRPITSTPGWWPASRRPHSSRTEPPQTSCGCSTPNGGGAEPRRPVLRSRWQASPRCSGYSSACGPTPAGFGARRELTPCLCRSSR
jgi:hypothetical protein